MVDPIKKIAPALLLSLMAGSVQAVPFNAFDPKSMAMGGVGVAVPSSGAASIFNPALLSVADQREDFAIEIPMVGARVYDPDDFVDAVDDFDDTVIDDVDDAINDLNSQISTYIPGNHLDTQFARDTFEYAEQEVLSISDKPMQIDGGAGILISIPNENFGIAVTALATASFSGILEYKDAETVADITADLLTIDICSQDPDYVDCIVNADFQTDYVEVDPTATNPLQAITFNASSADDVISDLESKVTVLGVVVSEIGLSLSREFNVLGTDVSFGITPKAMQVFIFDYEANADTADSEDFNGEDYLAEYNDFNMDFGVAMDHKNGWRSGLVIRNLISKEYDATNYDEDSDEDVKTGNSIKLEPQVRAGVSYTNDWSTYAFDLDLTENAAVGIADDNSQYAGLGAEFDLFDTLQLRLGYRADLVNSERSTTSVGIGLSPFGIHLDVAAAVNDNEVGGSLQFGFRF